ncbi:DNA-binding GntR family transcriptional regulator [Rhizobium binae]|uniref:DNA-binding GntR family transcriptional regulator n=1 Tax=Rhizobium binae TaxID=1138190 RepID=A0ABV2MMK8_9HYPH|nr:GntR family transcriptional regulator [Rhizobium binae]MBX4994579.1 GntR family transcriptional regulator [Rhizobium binae]NKL50333.1 FCD domain-containing protein [Rhizobium leguminosarum bv. viciae]QSY84788.1 GntR family transcriptional regulator [Rhizobium binae]
MAKVVAPAAEAKSKQQLAYDYIKAGIDRGLYAPKQRLVIDTLAKELSISPVPVREAIRRLEAESLVIFSKNSGAIVAGADPDLWAEQMELLAVLEGYVTGAAAPRITAGDIKELQKINERMAEALASFDLSGWTQGNLDFHSVINRRCPNETIVEQIAQLRSRIAMINRFIQPRTEATILHTLGKDSGKSTLHGHEWIIAAYIAKKAPVEIEAHVRTNIISLTAETHRNLIDNHDRRVSRSQG